MHYRRVGWDVCIRSTYHYRPVFPHSSFIVHGRAGLALRGQPKVSGCRSVHMALHSEAFTAHRRRLAVNRQWLLVGRRFLEVRLHWSRIIPLCDISSGCCFFTGPWTVTRSSLRMLRRVVAFCRPLRLVLLLLSFPCSRSPMVGVLGLCWMWRDVPFARQRRPVVDVLGLWWLLRGSFDCFDPPPLPPLLYQSKCSQQKLLNYAISSSFSTRIQMHETLQLL